MKNLSRLTFTLILLVAPTFAALIALAPAAVASSLTAYNYRVSLATVSGKCGSANFVDGNTATEYQMTTSQTECWWQFNASKPAPASIRFLEIDYWLNQYDDKIQVVLCPSTATTSTSTGCATTPAITGFGVANFLQVQAPTSAGWANVKYLIIKRVSGSQLVHLIDVNVWNGQYHFATDQNYEKLLNSFWNFTYNNRPTSSTLTSFRTLDRTIDNLGYSLPVGKYVMFLDIGIGGNAGCYVPNIQTLQSTVTGALANITILKSFSADNYCQAGTYLVYFEVLAATDLGVQTSTPQGCCSDWYSYYPVGVTTGALQSKMWGEAAWIKIGSNYAFPIFPVAQLGVKADESQFFDTSTGNYVTYTPQDRFGFLSGTTASYQVTLAASKYYGNAIYVYYAEKGASSTEVLSLTVNGAQAPVIQNIITSDSVGQIFLVDLCNGVCSNNVARTYTMSLTNWGVETNVFSAAWKNYNATTLHGAPALDANNGLMQDGGGFFSGYFATKGTFLQPSKLHVNFWSINGTTKAPLRNVTFTYHHNASGFESTVFLAQNFTDLTGLNGAYTLVAIADGMQSLRAFKSYQAGILYTLDVNLVVTPPVGYTGSQYQTATSGIQTGTAVGLVITYAGPLNVTVPARIQINITRNFAYALFVGSDHVDPNTGTLQHNVVPATYWPAASANTLAFYYPPRTRSGAQDKGLYLLWVMNDTGVVLSYRKFFVELQATNWAVDDALITPDVVNSISQTGYASAQQAYQTQYQATLLSGQKTVRDQVYEDFQKVNDFAPFLLGGLLVLAAIRAFRR